MYECVYTPYTYTHTHIYIYNHVLSYTHVAATAGHPFSSAMSSKSIIFPIYPRPTLTSTRHHHPNIPHPFFARYYPAAVIPPFPRSLDPAGRVMCTCARPEEDGRMCVRAKEKKDGQPFGSVKGIF